MSDDKGEAPDRAAQVEAVLTLIEGGESERAACEKVGINRQTFRSSVLRVDAASHYVRACEALARDQVEKIEEVITDLRAGTITPDVARIELDARKWTASRLFRRTWGDKVDATLSGPNGGPIPHKHQIDLSKLSEEELAVVERLVGPIADAGGNPGGEDPPQG